MKLGKALATGIADEQPHEQPRIHEEELELPEEPQDVEASAREEVPGEVPAVR